jgi:outer membrane protein assembly factor BamB
MAASLTSGQLLWNISAGVDFPLFSGSTAVADHGKYAIRFDDAYYYAWDLHTGSLVWKSELSSVPWEHLETAVESAYGLILPINMTALSHTTGLTEKSRGGSKRQLYRSKLLIPMELGILMVKCTLGLAMA